MFVVEKSVFAENESLNPRQCYFSDQYEISVLIKLFQDGGVRMSSGGGGGGSSRSNSDNQEKSRKEKSSTKASKVYI